MFLDIRERLQGASHSTDILQILRPLGPYCIVEVLPTSVSDNLICPFEEYKERLKPTHGIVRVVGDEAAKYVLLGDYVVFDEFATVMYLDAEDGETDFVLVSVYDLIARSETRHDVRVEKLSYTLQ